MLFISDITGYVAIFQQIFQMASPAEKNDK